VAGGLTNRNIAEYLNLSPHTVDAHLKHTFTKLNIHSRVELTVLALEHR
jgi:DNA-binding NarL/FixJ family response regulator